VPSVDLFSFGFGDNEIQEKEVIDLVRMRHEGFCSFGKTSIKIHHQ